ESLIDKHPHNDWLLLLSTRPMQEWFQLRGEFALVAGTRFEGIHLPAIDIASYAAGVHAAHTLFGLGHRQLVLFTPSVFNAGVLATGAGLRQAMSRARYAVANMVVVMCNEETTDICRAVDRVLAEAVRPTVLIGAKTASMLTAFSHLMRLGLRVPHDVSLLSIEWEPYLDMVVPRIARYEMSPERLARQIARVILRRSTGNAEASYIIPEFVPGASLRRLTV
ncbi:MAG: LacI family transcriptional regulator, partial [Opitutaceae bacterium]|nr:LacI family transcriptional regulator [Opitutaceae bacterium]